ncbi:hypothetical protein LX32DRAFT_104801 [Colletotrichum zoysiae]|uniref:Uncharacterized protein n=1 Tax=Colletotrichum zoysiae TaxID=1216348 RepID=A0AAD9HSX8_9PEZI|nr:hypothetical protein LX32DRAFT_104801 [Colletotrichum zoysiae]
MVPSQRSASVPASTAATCTTTSQCDVDTAAGGERRRSPSGRPPRESGPEGDDDQRGQFFSGKAWPRNSTISLVFFPNKGMEQGGSRFKICHHHLPLPFRKGLRQPWTMRATLRRLDTPGLPLADCLLRLPGLPLGRVIGEQTH